MRWWCLRWEAEIPDADGLILASVFFFVHNEGFA